MFKRLIASLVCLSFIFSNFQLSYAQSGSLYSGEFSVNQLPVPGKMLGVSETFAPILVKGLIVHPDQPLNFDFIVDSGNDTTDQAVIKEQSEKIVKYFLAALTVPENSLWVNLSPYEKDRIIDQNLGQTLLGRDMLAQDYVLKQLTASMIYPEDKLGKDFWSRIYQDAQKKFGTTDIPVSTFNKVWIVPQKAEVFEKNNAVYVTQASLKVMLESDYMAMSKNTAVLANPDALKGDKKGDLTKNIIRQLVLPAIEKEVNQGRNFATLRQVYYAAILAKWYRALIQGTLMSQAYVGTNKILGVNCDDKTVKEQIYQRYIAAYKKGVFNYIKEDNNILTGERIPRKYFSGGEILARIPMTRSSGQGLDRSSTGKIFKVEFAMKPDRDEPDALPASEKQEIRGRITGMLENGQWDLVVGEIKRAREAMEFSVFWGNSPGTSTREWNYSMQHSNNVMETIVDTIRTSDKKDQFFQSQAWLTSKETVKIKVPRINYISTRKEYEQMYIQLERAVPVMLLNSDKVYPEDRSASLFDYKRVIVLKDTQGDEYVFQISYSDNNYGHINIYFTPQSAIPIPFTTVGVGFTLENKQINWSSLTWGKAIERSVSEYKARFITNAMNSMVHEIYLTLVDPSVGNDARLAAGRVYRQMKQQDPVSVESVFNNVVNLLRSSDIVRRTVGVRAAIAMKDVRLARLLIPFQKERNSGLRFLALVALVEMGNEDAVMAWQGLQGNMDLFNFYNELTLDPMADDMEGALRSVDNMIQNAVTKRSLNRAAQIIMHGTLLSFMRGDSIERHKAIENSGSLPAFVMSALVDIVVANSDEPLGFPVEISEAISKIDNQELTTALIAALDNSNPAVKTTLMTILADRKAVQAEAKITDILRTSKQASLRAVAAWALGWIGGKAAAESLLVAGKNEKDPNVLIVVQEAARVLKEIKTEAISRPGEITQAMTSKVTPEDVATNERYEAKLKEFAAASDWTSYKDLLVRAMEVKLISNKEQLKEPLQRLETGRTLTEYLDVMFRAVELRVISRIRYRQLRRPLSYMVRMALLADEFGTMEATDQCWNDYRHVILKALELNVFTNKEQLKEALKNLVDHVEMNGEIEQKVAESGVMGRAADLGENRTLSDFETTVPKDQKSLFAELQELANEEDGDLYSELLLKALELKEITKDEELKGPLKTLSDAGRWDGYLDVLLKAAELKVISHLDYDELMKTLRKLRAAYSYEGWHREAPVISRKNETSGYTKAVLKALELRIISHEEQLKEPLQELADGNRWDEYLDVVFKAIELKIMSGYSFEQLRKPLETLAVKGYRWIFVDLVQKAIELKVINNYEQLNETLGLTPAIEGQDLDGESVQHFFLDESSYFEVISTALRLKVINNKGRLQELLRGKAARSISRRYHQRIVAQAIEVGLIKSPGEITQAMQTPDASAAKVYGDKPNLVGDLTPIKGLIAARIPAGLQGYYDVHQRGPFHYEGPTVLHHVQAMYNGLIEIQEHHNGPFSTVLPAYYCDLLRQNVELFKWYVLLHDLGKGPTFTERKDGSAKYADHENVSARLMDENNLAAGFPQREVLRKLVALHGRMGFKSDFQGFLKKENLSSGEMDLLMVAIFLDRYWPHQDNRDYGLLMEDMKQIIASWEKFKQQAMITSSDLGGIDIKDIKVEEKSSGRRVRFNDAAMKAIFNGKFNGFSPVFMSITSVESPMSALGAGSVQGPEGALTKA